MIRYFVLVCAFALSACTSGGQPSSKISAADVVEVVQKAESTFPGVPTSDAIAGLLGIMKRRGASVNIVGWSQDYKSGTHDVWFKVKTDGELSEFHWIVTPDGMITPANKLAQGVTKKQLAAAR